MLKPIPKETYPRRALKKREHKILPVSFGLLCLQKEKPN